MATENSTIAYWRDLSAYDLKVAESMLEKGHYLYVGFMCHQSVEKMLKALYVLNHKAVPPYTHKLDKLLELANFEEVADEIYDLIDALSPLNIQARYPAYKEALYKLIDYEKASEILEKTKEFILWLRKRIN